MFDERIMKNLVAECKNELESIGLQLPTINYVLNTRAKKRMGQCRSKIKNVYYEIELSKNYMDIYAKQNNFSEIKNTIIHEMLHTLPNCMNHGNQWQSYANTVNRKLGYKISRLASVDNEVKQEMVQKAKYHVICNECGQIYYHNRKTKYFDVLDRCSCHKCKGSLKLIQNY